VGGRGCRRARYVVVLKNERGKCMDVIGHIIGHSGIKPIAWRFIQHHRAVQPLTVTYRLHLHP